jgi:hypothetical protein
MFAAMLSLVVGSGVVVVVRIFLMLGALALSRRFPAAAMRRRGNGTAVRMSSAGGLGRLCRLCCPLPAALIIVVCVVILVFSSLLELREKTLFVLFLILVFCGLPKYEKLFFCITQKFDF